VGRFAPSQRRNLVRESSTAQNLMSEDLSPATKTDGRSLHAMQRRLRTRELLLRSARALLHEGKNLNVADIASHAEVAVATVYNHFAGPEEILRAITEELVDRSIKDAQAIVRSTGSRAASEMFPALLCESFSALRDNPTTTTIPGVFLADPEIIEKLYRAVHLLLSEAEVENTDQIHQRSRTITYVLLGALIRAEDYMTPNGASYRPDNNAEAVADLLRSIVKSISYRD
jgi:AcrR family transcriptional regulator